MEEQLGAMAKQEFINVIRGMNDEEMTCAIKYFPMDILWDELRRRESHEREMVKSIKETLKLKEEI